MIALCIFSHKGFCRFSKRAHAFRFAHRSNRLTFDAVRKPAEPVFVQSERNRRTFVHSHDEPLWFFSAALLLIFIMILYRKNLTERIEFAPDASYTTQDESRKPIRRFYMALFVFSSSI